VVAKILIPKGTDKKTLDFQLAPPDLVVGAYGADGKSTSAQWVGD